PRGRFRRRVTVSDEVQRRVSRRQFLGTAAGAARTIGAGSVDGEAFPQAPPATGAGGQAARDQTLVLVNGRIHTMNAGNAVVNTVSIRNGRFIAVGSRAPAAPNTKVVDLK